MTSTETARPPAETDLGRPAAASPAEVPFSPLDEGAWCSERSRWPMTVLLEIRSRDRLDVRRLRAAIAEALRVQPLANAHLAGSIHGVGALRWALPAEPVVELLEGESVSALLSRPFDVRRSPRVRFLLERGADGAGDRLALSVHHASLDGRAGLRLLEAVSVAYAGGAGETPAAATVAPPESHQPVPGAGPGASDDSRGGPLRGIRHVLGTPPVDRLWAPDSGHGTGYGVSYLQLEAEVSAELVTGRPSDVSVNDVLLAASHVALDAWNRRHGAPAGNFGIVMPIHQGGAADRPAGMAGNATSQASVYSRPDQRSTAAAILETVATQTAGLKAPGGSYEPSTSMSALAGLPLDVRRRLPALASWLTRERSTATTRLANLGQASEVLADPAGLAAESLWFSPPCRPPQTLVLGAVGFAGRVGLTARWCRPDWDDADAEAFLALVRSATTSLLRGTLPVEAATAPARSADDADDADTEVPQGVRRTLRLAKLFREEQRRPEPFYRFLARDTVAAIEAHRTVRGARALDIGGGPGYIADALESAGAECYVVDYNASEFTLFGRRTARPFVGDGCRLPVADACLDVVVSSNVLEHVPDAQALLSEAVRVLRPGGIAYICFTNWYSPWGGHETSPWHYLGGRKAMDRYETTTRLPAKNRFNESLFPVHVGQTLSWVRQQPGIRLVDAAPRYYPTWTRPMLRVPGVREVATWNLALLLAPAPAAARVA